jgi:hypothetical protein
MERMPCGQFGANAVFFRIGVLAYNHGRLFVLKMAGYLLAPSPGADAAVETLRDGGQGCLSWWRTLAESQASCERPLRCRTIAKPAMCLWIRRYTIRKEP